MELIGTKVALRPYTLERCHAFFRDYVADTAMTYDAYVYDKERVDRYYQVKVMDKTRRFFAICHGDEAIGEIQLKRIDFDKGCGTLSVHLINDTVKGKGFGTEAQRLIVGYAKELGLRTLYADAVHRNHRSKHILQKLGFEHLRDDDILAYYSLVLK